MFIFISFIDLFDNYQLIVHVKTLVLRQKKREKVKPQLLAAADWCICIIQ